MMNLVMFGYFVSTQYFSDMTDINLKEMLFKNKMKQIEDDMVPFGFIDDGQAHMEVLEGRECDTWQIKDFNPDLEGLEGVFDRDQ